MLRKASEILAEITLNSDPSFQQELRTKKIVMEFENCGVCGGEIAFHHRRDVTGHAVIEDGQCRHCQEKLPARRYKIN